VNPPTYFRGSRPRPSGHYQDCILNLTVQNCILAYYELTIVLSSVIWHCWFGGRKGIWPVVQGAPWSWKVMEFRKTIFQALKVMENSKGHGKVMESDDNVMEFLLLH